MTQDERHLGHVSVMKGENITHLRQLQVSRQLT